MKKIMALVMTLVLAFGTTGALAATDYSNGYTANVTVNVNKDLVSGLLYMLMMDGEDSMSPEAVNALLDVVNLASFDVAADFSNVDMTANLNGQPMARLQGTVSEEGIVMATDLLPTYAIQLDKATMDQMGMQFNANMDPAKAQQAQQELVAGMEKVLTEAMDSLNPTVLLAEPVEMVYNEDVTFNYVHKVSVPAADAMTALRDALQKVVDLMAAYIQATGIQMPQEMDMAQLKEQLATMPIPEGEENTPIYISEYVIMEGETAKEGYSYSQFEIADGSSVVYVDVAQLMNVVEFGIYAGEGEQTCEEIINAAYSGASKGVVMEMTVEQGETEEDAKVYLSMVIGGMLVGAYVEAAAVAEGGNDMMMELYFLTDQAPMLTLNMACRPLTGEVAKADLTGKTVVSMADLQGENADAVAQALSLEAQQSLNSLLVKAVTAAPEQVQALMNAITALQVQPEPTVVE